MSAASRSDADALQLTRLVGRRFVGGERDEAQVFVRLAGRRRGGRRIGRVLIGARILDPDFDAFGCGFLCARSKAFNRYV